jgi:DinB superfamily
VADSTIEKGNTASYQDKLLGLLGAQAPLDVLARTPAFMQRVVAENPAALLHCRAYAGKWTPCEILGHLIDADVIYNYRVRNILCDDRPRIIGVDQDLWVAGQRYNDADPRELAEQFAFLRRMTLQLWRKVRPEDEARAGVHNERGEERLGMMLKMHAGHDLSHIDQITRYVAAARGGAGK